MSLAMAKLSKVAEIPYVDFDLFGSAYYTDRHKRFRQLCRDFVTKEVLPYANKWEKQGKYPRELYTKTYAAGIYAFDHPAKYGGTPFEGKKSDKFMEMIFADEFAQAALPGMAPGVFNLKISVPPVMHFGNEYQKKMFEPVIRAEKIAALAVSETKHGSDVASLETTAVKSECGRYYIVNGEKKWISCGTKADYFVTTVRTGDPQSKHKGLSILIIPRMEGVTSFRIPMQGLWTSDTSQVFFKNVRVPVENLIGKENKGFYYMMFNFNQERFGILVGCIGFMKAAFIEAVNYARVRKVFGKPLIKSQVIRHKLAEMARVIIATRCMAEQCAYQMLSDPLGVKDPSIGTNIALCKVQASKSLEFVAREASQILGGKSYILGNRIDRIFRGVRAYAIFGGSEEILLEASTRLARL